MLVCTYKKKKVKAQVCTAFGGQYGTGARGGGGGFVDIGCVGMFLRVVFGPRADCRTEAACRKGSKQCTDVQ
jgi:hypothetical protein